MADQQTRATRDDVYDHEHDEPRSARRRRPVADWGVGDDVFDHMPRSRFSRAAEGPSRDRRFGRADGPERRGAAAAEPEAGSEESAAPADEYREARTADDAREVRTADDRRAGVPRGRVEDGRRTLVIGRPEDVPSEIAAITADRDLGDIETPALRARDAADVAPGADAAPDADPALGAERPTAAAGERRTVRIGGRPEGSLEAARFHRDNARRRPPRTAHERIGARPDRLAMWAVALGLLLILIAVLS